MRILLTGGNGLLGRAMQRVHAQMGTPFHLIAPGSDRLDLRNQGAVNGYFEREKFDLVIHAAARVGGIAANIAHPVTFLADNLLINTHVIEAARNTGIRQLIFLGSSCMYPKDFGRPLREADILAAPLEPTNESYAISKIAGARHCEAIAREMGLAYRTLIPPNLYGPDDHFDLERGHLVAAALFKVHQAKVTGAPSVEIWGDGTARREFLYVDDLARFILQTIDRLQELPVNLNVGFGTDFSVNEYYQTAADVVGYKGRFSHNLAAPVGMQMKLTDSTCATAYGWQPTTSLRHGMTLAYSGMLARQRQ